MKNLAAVLLAVSFGAGSAFAQPAPEHRWPTKLDPVPRSLERLLNDGYAVVGMGMGPLFTLKSGARWVMCEVRLAAAAAFGLPATPPQSECYALN